MDGVIFLISFLPSNKGWCTDHFCCHKYKCRWNTSRLCSSYIAVQNETEDERRCKIRPHTPHPWCTNNTPHQIVKCCYPFLSNMHFIEVRLFSNEMKSILDKMPTFLDIAINLQRCCTLLCLPCNKQLRLVNCRKTIWQIQKCHFSSSYCLNLAQIAFRI